VALGNFIRSLFGRKAEAVIADDPFGAKTPAASVVRPAAAPRPPPAIVQRDEIIDGRARIAGYRFIARTLNSGVAPSAPASVAALHADNLPAFAERRLAIVPLDVADWQSADFRTLCAPHTTFLLTAAAGDDQRWRQTAAEIRAAGGRIAVAAGASGAQALLGSADLVLVDFRAYSLPAFEQLIKALLGARPAPAIAADGIGSWAEHRLCQAMGVGYSLGGFAATPEGQDHGEQLTQSRLVLIDMLNLLRREADLVELSALAKRDPGIAVKVVAMANSPLSGLTNPVASLEQAMLVLGRATLYRWLSLAMFRSGDGGGRDEALLELALFRGRLLELLARVSRREKVGELASSSTLPTAVCISGSWRSTSWSFRSS
jgi:EAL and modified HD-GYP domain-containing signal transduction protein